MVIGEICCCDPYWESSLHFIVTMIVFRGVIFLAEWTHGPTSEEHHPLHLPVEEEVVEVPDGAVLPEWI